MPGPVFQWRRRSTWLWIIRGLFAVLYLLWGGRRLARGIDVREWRAIEECGCAVAPLLLFALIWLLADSAQRPNARAMLA
jgi:hypothetical protein